MYSRRPGKQKRLVLHANGSVPGWTLLSDSVTSGGNAFQHDQCGWQDVSTGQFQWVRGRNATPSDNTGPSVDHTLGTPL
ncbi:hypothetical protein CRUP_021069, partial [Coryphaenoides rupestris]